MYVEARYRCLGLDYEQVDKVPWKYLEAAGILEEANKNETWSPFIDCRLKNILEEANKNETWSPFIDCRLNYGNYLPT
jgi:hypothetical protein